MNYLFCAVCNKQLDSAQNWQAHIIGKAHQSRVRTAAAIPAQMFCSLCNKQCVSQANFEQHCKSNAHLLRTIPLNVPAVPAVPVFNFDITNDEDEWKIVSQPQSAQVIAHVIYMFVVFESKIL